VLLRRAKAGAADLEGFLTSQGVVKCRDARELALATETLILEGTITGAVRQMDSLLRKARKAGLDVPLRVLSLLDRVGCASLILPHDNRCRGAQGYYYPKFCI
jgi:hypothetical protein